MAIRQTFPAVTQLDGDGAGVATFTARGDVLVEHTRVTVAPVAPATSVVNMPAAVLYLNGQEFEGSYTGANDQSDTRHLMLAGDTLECRWTGGDPNARATFYVRGVEYPAGQGIKATT